MDIISCGPPSLLKYLGVPCLGACGPRLGSCQVCPEKQTMRVVEQEDQIGDVMEEEEQMGHEMEEVLPFSLQAIHSSSESTAPYCSFAAYL